MLASRSLPMATTAESKSGMPSSRRAASSVESAWITWVSLSEMFWTSFSSLSIPRTSRPPFTSYSASDVPKRPRPIRAMVEVPCLLDARVFSLLGIFFSIRAQCLGTSNNNELLRKSE
jgi:hypothetical protein